MNGIAIVGMSCRWPGADSVREFWSNLAQGIESVVFFSDAELRAAGVPDALIADPRYVKASPILKDIESFDAAFFEYSPREATLIDPQQRIFLEVAWEAFEDAGYTPNGANGVVGVFAGGGSVVTSYLVAHHGHPSLTLQTAGLPHISNDKDFFGTRISYKLNLTGPSITVQTACSTSLVALHLACRSIAAGECDMALAGASSIRMPDRTGYVAEKGNIYSLDGHCRAFDGEGQGTIFGSGVAALLLKDVRRAIEDGDHIYAVVKGTAINNDGAQKISFAAPSATGQTRAFIDALATAGVHPDSVQYVECHATGTIVGDPIEIEALTDAFRRHTDRRGYCAVGSVKTNIGHPEQAAGFAGLMKTALALYHRRIPPSINYRTPNPAIDFEESPFFVNAALCDWPPGNEPRRALVNSLGIGGTNAVAILEEAPSAPAPEASEDWPVHLLTLSAKNDAALMESMRRLRAHIGADEATSLADVCYTSNVSRASHAHRVAIAATDLADLTRQLDQLVDAPRPSHIKSVGRSERKKIGFLFTGQGAQFFGMGRALYQSQPVFRSIVDSCATRVAPELDVPILDVIFADPSQSKLLSQTRYTQPALFIIEYALAELWREFGVRPDAVLGHSIGELVAACVAGVFDLDDALRLVVARARLMQALPSGGAMAVVFDAEDNTRRTLADFDGRVDIAAVNGPTTTVVSGASDAVHEVLRALEADGRKSQSLDVSHAFHSRLMEPMLEELRTYAERVAHRAPRMPLVSNVSGRVHEGAPDADYWLRHAREAVRFADGVRTLRDIGCQIFIEIGPGTGLLSAARASLANVDARWLASLGKKPGEDWRAMLESSRQLYLDGVPISFKALHAHRALRRVSLPTYPFQRKRCWIDDTRVVAVPARAPAAPARPAAAEQSASFAHPLLGAPILGPNSEIRFEARCSLAEAPYLRDHRVNGVPVLPTVAALEAVLAAGRAQLQDDQLTLESVIYQEALVLQEQRGRSVELVLTPQGSDGAAFRLASADTDTSSRWRTHLSGYLRRATVDGKRVPDSTAGSRCTDPVAPDEYYREVRDLGLDYGPIFRGVQRMQRGQREVLANIALPAAAPPDNYPLHPAFLDACLHIYPALTNGQARGAAFLPIGVERFYLNGGRASHAIAHGVLRQLDTEHGTAKVDIDVFDGNAELIASFGGLTVKQLGARGEPKPSLPDRAGWLYRIEWAKLPAPEREPRPSKGHWIIFAGEGGLGESLAQRLVRGGSQCSLVRARRKRRTGGESAGHVHHIDPAQPAEFDQVLQTITSRSDQPVAGVVYLWGLDASAADRLTSGELQAAEARVLGGALHAAQSIIRFRESNQFPARLWLLTRGTQAVSGREKVEPASASLWGFGRTLAAEHPGLWGGLLDLPLRKAAAPTEDGRAIHAALGRTDDEDQVAVRGELRYGARLRRVPSDARGVPAALSAGATYLITGGLGTIGLGIAERLVAQGARSLVLSGRSGAKEAAREVIAGLEARGATVRVVQADVADESDMRALFESLRGGLPLRGVVHCAGVLDDGTVAQLPWHKFESVLASKSRGAWLLHRFTRRLRLDFFIVQSSILSQIGSPGQANYTAANAFLDSLVAYRRALGLPATAINWGAWAEHGMAASAGARGEAMWRARGMRFIPLDAGFAMFDELMARQLGDVTVTIMDWAAFVKNRGARPALCRDLVEEPVTIATPQPATRQTEPLPRPTSAAPGALQTGRAWLIDFLGKEIAERLGVEGALDPQQPLDELGLDSLMSVTLANRIEQALGVTVPIGTLIRGVSIAQVADKLLPRVTIPAGQLSAATPPAFEAPAIEWSSEPDGPDVPAQSSTTCVASPELAPPIQLRDAPAREVPAPRDVPQTPRSARDVRATRVSRDRWLVFPRPNPAAKARLFCFPFAGGGAAPYRPWLDRLDPAIELVAIEPPGHGGRIKERPLTTVEPYLKAVTRAMSSSYLDKPCALFGACLGGLIAYEVARRLLMSGLGDPVHFFVAGARPPHRVGDFTPFEEELLKYTLALPEYDFDRPAYEQPDVVMGEYIRRFNMDAANEMLTHRELRKLLMPAIRADFAITARYSPTPIATWPLAITAFHGLADPYVSREQALEWSRYTGRSFKLAMRPGAHDMMVHEQAFVIDSINQELR